MSVTQRLRSSLAASPQRCGAQLRELASTLREGHVLEIIDGNDILLRPGLLTAAQRARLERDLPRLLDLLASLPDRLYGGDAGAMCDGLGIDGPGREAVSATWADEALIIGRADLIREQAAFKLVEFNVHSSAGGLENADLARAMLARPPFADFAQAEGLSFIDTIDRLAAALRRTASRRGVVGAPRVAVMDWHTTYPTYERSLRRIAALLCERGIDAIPCHVGHAALRDGRLYVNERPIDLLYRIFLIEDLTHDSAPLAPILAAHAAGNLTLVMSFGAELIGNKGALALLSEAAASGALAGTDRETVERYVPWTRLVRDVELERRGKIAPLTQIAENHRSELVLKPIIGHGGSGVIPGWTTDQEEWRSALAEAMQGRISHVLQDRVRPAPEWMPQVDRAGVRFVPTSLNWGAFVIDGEFAGCMIRGAEVGRSPIINVTAGAGIGCCLYAGGPASSESKSAGKQGSANGSRHHRNRGVPSTPGVHE